MELQLKPIQEILKSILPAIPRLASIVTHGIFGARAAMQQGAPIIDGILFGVALESMAQSSFGNSLPGGAAVAIGYAKLAVDQFKFAPVSFAPETQDLAPGVIPSLAGRTG